MLEYQMYHKIPYMQIFFHFNSPVLCAESEAKKKVCQVKIGITIKCYI